MELLWNSCWVNMRRMKKMGWEEEKEEEKG